MRTLLLIAILVLLAGSWIGAMILHDSGYVLLTYGRWSVEMSLWVAAALQLLGLIVFYLLLRSVMGLVRTPAAMKQWISEARMRRTNRNIARGMRLFAEGHWQKARKDLVGSAVDSEFPLINYLVAAWAADRQGDDRQRDELLEKARSADDHSQLAVELTRTRILMERGQLDEAAMLVEALRKEFPQHDYALMLLQQIYLGQENWYGLSKLLPELRKRKLKADVQTLETRVYAALLHAPESRTELNIPAEERLRRINEIWGGLSATQRCEEMVVVSYVEHLISLGAEPRAEDVLRTVLRKNWRISLVRLYGLVAGENVSRQLSVAEEWNRLHPNNAVLQLTLGRLCLRNELWGKARHYFESSLELIKDPETYAELGHLLEFLGEAPAGQDCYRRGIAKMAPHLVSIALPEDGVRATLASGQG